MSDSTQIDAPNGSTGTDPQGPNPLEECFSSDFLAQQQFGTYNLRNEGGKLLKLPSHKNFNNPPFSPFDPAAQRVAFHLTASNHAVVDLDGCFNSEQRVKTWALKFVQKWTFKTAHETSASGYGAHFFLKVVGEIPPDLHGEHSWGSKPDPRKDDTGKAELYVNKKWIALTGRAVYNEPHPEVLEITPDELRELRDELSVLAPTSPKSAMSPSVKTTPVESGSIEITQKADLTSRVLAMISGAAKVEDRSLADHALAEWLYKIYGSNDAKVREEFLKHYWKRDHADPEMYIANTLKHGKDYAAMHGLIRSEKQILDPDTWPELFHTYEQIANVPSPKWIIEGFAEEFDKVMIGALSGHGKTLILLAVVRALLRSRDEKDAKLFGHFPVPNGEHKIMYLIPEEGLAKFSRRLRSFNLLPFVEEQRLLVRTLSLGPNVKLTDPRILRAAQGRHVVLDTAIRFSEGDENAASDNQNGLAQSVFNLESAGAASVWGAHHAPKSFSKDTYMELENVLRGSGDIGAMLSTAYGVRQLDDDRSQTRLHVRCIKPRDIDPPGDFQLEGKPWIDREHDFRMVSKPGETENLSQYLKGDKHGRPSCADERTKLQAVLALLSGKTQREVAEGSGVDHTTVGRWKLQLEKEAAPSGKPLKEYVQMCLKQSEGLKGNVNEQLSFGNLNPSPKAVADCVNKLEPF